MRFLIDTHVWLWWMSDDPRLSRKAVELTNSPRSEILFSAASAWEIAIKHQLGKLRLPEPPSQFVPDRLALHSMVSLEIHTLHALEAGGLPLHHRDPFDRLLVAQSLVEKLPILTGDEAFAPYGVKILPA